MFSGEEMIKKGAEGNIFYMIQEGTVSVTDMGDQFSNHTLTAGDYFGERALLTGEPRAATITAQTAVKVMALDRESFNLLLGPLKEVLDHNMNLLSSENSNMHSPNPLPRLTSDTKFQNRDHV